MNQWHDAKEPPPAEGEYLVAAQVFTGVKYIIALWKSGRWIGTNGRKVLVWMEIPTWEEPCKS